jgi:hypothetical protein
MEIRRSPYYHFQLKQNLEAYKYKDDRDVQTDVT